MDTKELQGIVLKNAAQVAAIGERLAHSAKREERAQAADEARRRTLPETRTDRGAGIRPSEGRASAGSILSARRHGVRQRVGGDVRHPQPAEALSERQGKMELDERKEVIAAMRGQHARASRS
jgi:hypothetical protein